jgi:hypothetical protein
VHEASDARIPLLQLRPHLSVHASMAVRVLPRAVACYHVLSIARGVTAAAAK